ncbi:MAG: hypothetical protein RLZZ245_2939 [Verrucomicrobiota bacterium]
MGEHERENVVGAGLGIDARAVGDDESTLGGHCAEFWGVVAGESSAADLDPSEIF